MTSQPYEAHEATNVHWARSMLYGVGLSNNEDAAGCFCIPLEAVMKVRRHVDEGQADPMVVWRLIPCPLQAMVYAILRGMNKIPSSSSVSPIVPTCAIPQTASAYATHESCGNQIAQSSVGAFQAESSVAPIAVCLILGLYPAGKARVALTTAETCMGRCDGDVTCRLVRLGISLPPSFDFDCRAMELRSVHR
jgi:hypothetical protein